MGLCSSQGAFPMSVLQAPRRRYVPVSLTQLFSIGLGPSSSHTVGPMRAAKTFVEKLEEEDLLQHTRSMVVELFGSLAMTGKGHATDIAVLLGLEGSTPEGTDPNEVAGRVEAIEKGSRINLIGKHEIEFVVERDLIFNKGKRFTFHSNAMRFKAFDPNGKLLASEIYYSVGGGFIVAQNEAFEPSEELEQGEMVLYPFQTAEELLSHCNDSGLTIAQVVMENEKTWRGEGEVRRRILEIWAVMRASVERGCSQEGTLPGGLNVKRRAPQILKTLQAKGDVDPSDIFSWISLYALAVNEENAAGGRVVTAPTNGASGVIPAVLHYYLQFTPGSTEEGIMTFFLTATAIGILFKEGASLSAAEMGCQGEVGVACSMAAAGLCAAMGGTNEQIENAAEIGMEHNLGLTCDPIGGLVQIPCIERNTKGALFAINAALLALHGDGTHRVSLDQVIAAMRATGEDMHSKYKETAEGGLALYVPLSSPCC